MGFAISWFAIREENAERFFQSLGLSPTGETEELPDSLISTAKMDTGWRVLWYNEYTCPFLGERDLRRISKDYDVLMCLVEEHVMASSAELWSGGKRKWWLSHQGEEGPKGLDTEGGLPDCFSTIRQEQEQLQAAKGGEKANVDHIFDIPLNVAESIVGFKHDEDSIHLVDKVFMVLSRPASSKSFLLRLLGK